MTNSEWVWHVPVLYGEIINSLHFFEEGKNIIVDATLGRWGHAAGVIEKLGKDDVFIGIDCDAENLRFAQKYITDLQKKKWKHPHSPRIYFQKGNFRDIDQYVADLWYWHITALYADLWVSSVHFDTPERGFSYRFDGPLDMRLDPDGMNITAKTLIQTLPYEKLAEMFRLYGDEPKAWYIAKKIIEARKQSPLKTTQDLVAIIKSIHPDILPRVFQALRIAVNQEYDALTSLLSKGIKLLSSWGSISIISFHSWEDRIVKHFFREQSKWSINPLTGQEMEPGVLKIETKKPITPGQNEIEQNPRARSALLRIGYKN